MANNLDRQYQKLLQNVLENGKTKKIGPVLALFLSLELQLDMICQRAFLY